MTALVGLTTTRTGVEPSVQTSVPPSTGLTLVLRGLRFKYRLSQCSRRYCCLANQSGTSHSQATAIYCRLRLDRANSTGRFLLVQLTILLISHHKSILIFSIFYFILFIYIYIIINRINFIYILSHENNKRKNLMSYF